MSSLRKHCGRCGVRPVAVEIIQKQLSFRLCEQCDREREQELKTEGSVAAFDQHLASEAEQFLNRYEHCGQSWEDQWDCMCNDRCPVCNKEIEPIESTLLHAGKSMKIH